MALRQLRGATLISEAWQFLVEKKALVFRVTSQLTLPNLVCSSAFRRFWPKSGLKAELRTKGDGEVHPPNGTGPKCSAMGPKTAAGRNKSAPTKMIVPSKTK